MRQLDPRRLEILEQAPGASSDEGFITFKIARRILRDAKTRAFDNDTVTERSRFVRVGGRWLYTESEFVICVRYASDAPGSGSKYLVIHA